MKLRTLGLCKAAFLLAASLFLTTAKAEVIQNDVVMHSPSQDQSSDQWLTFQSMLSSSGEGFFAFGLKQTSPGSFAIFSRGIAERYGLYEAAPGDVLDAAFVASHTPIVANFGNRPPVTLTFQQGETKLFAFWDAGFGPRAETYGWVNLTWTGSGLSVSSSARAVGSGIIVATTTPVPEPASALLFLLGGAMCLIVRQRRQSALGC